VREAQVVVAVVAGDASRRDGFERLELRHRLHDQGRIELLQHVAILFEQ
jgi:hypothetical protein